MRRPTYYWRDWIQATRHERLLDPSVLVIVTIGMLLEWIVQLVGWRVVYARFLVLRMSEPVLRHREKRLAARSAATLCASQGCESALKHPQ